ncbi:MAG: phosphoribosyltransferase family protein [Halothiobacillaceae bacterium]|jgi:adenine phosphoribosyltransferase|nr:phosphoribosyltransferase family protein [Halothiobacillaceae bacterium]MDY0050456.1 phosphoribosyltransferase family protein [Halothiobacillaceae bacterium]
MSSPEIPVVPPHPKTPIYTLMIDEACFDLPIHPVAPGLSIAVLNLLGDTRLTDIAARALAVRLAKVEFDSLLTAETKSIPLIHELARLTIRPYAVLRKHYRTYMGQALSYTTRSITTGQTQTLHLDERDLRHIRDRRVLIVDDVISTGSTLHAMKSLVVEAGGTVAGTAAICTEGDDPQQWKNEVIALAHLPLFRDLD